MFNWLKGKKKEEKMEINQPEVNAEEAEENMYEKHRIVKVGTESYMAEVAKNQQEFMDNLLGKNKD